MYNNTQRKLGISLITISLCMIVKNEEQNLRSCLDCLKDIVDEMIIVDTGSTDRTKELALQCGAKIYDFTWIDDFAAARNFSFSQATMEYIYTADADEIIDEVNQDRFKVLKQILDPRIDIVEMKYTNQLEKGSTYNYDAENRPKLYKRVRKFQWIDPIHEIVDCRLNTFTSEIEIIHKPSESHAQRDLAHLAKITSSLIPLNSRLHMMYARQLFKAGTPEDFFRAFGYFSNCLIEQSKNEDLRITQCVLARCFNLQGDFYNLLKIATKNIRGNPSAEICCELGSYYMKEKDYDEALYWFYLAANSGNAELDLDYSRFIPNLQMSRCFLELGDLNEARNYHSVAASYKPNDQAIIANLKLLDNGSRPETSLS